MSMNPRIVIWYSSRQFQEGVAGSAGDFAGPAIEQGG
jgi:hypothetical protein